MLKLTNHRDRSAVYIAPTHIVSLTTSGQGTAVYVVGGHHHDVSETPDQIMALMPEASHPAYVTDPAGFFSEAAVLDGFVTLDPMRWVYGDLHPTSKEWRECPKCAAPAPTKLWPER